MSSRRAQIRTSDQNVIRVQLAPCGCGNSRSVEVTIACRHAPPSRIRSVTT